MSATFFFFFSSRRRHTRFDCDWSSDVCSSDLATLALSYRLGRRGSMTLTALYTGRRPDVDYRTLRRDTLPSYTRVDLAGQLDLRRPQAGAPGLAVVGKVENLFDAPYQEVTNFPDRKSTRLNSSHSQISY